MPSFLVAGASRGIGAQFIKTLSQDPSNVVVALVRRKATAQAITDIKGIHIIECDLDVVEAVESAAQQADALLPNGLDHFIYNAAFEVHGKPAPQGILNFESDPSALATKLTNSFRGNMISPLVVFLHFLPLVRKGALKRVIFISTGVSDFDFTRKADFALLFPYSVSKSALNYAALSLSIQLKTEGFTVIALSPGYVDVAEPNAPPPDLDDEALALLGPMGAAFSKAAPNWNGQPITPVQSVNYMLEVIKGLELEKDGGKLLSHLGSETEFL